jgi:hypothetical protein
MPEQELAILVLSCDKFADAWDPFFNMALKYWPDCPYRIYLCSETKNYENKRVTVIKPGRELPWSALLQWALEFVSEKYILFLLEDYIFLKPVETSRIERLFGVLKQTDSCYLRLFPCPGPDEPLSGYPGVGIIKPGSGYRNCTQAAIWKKAALQSIIEPNESGWEFELRGVKRADKLDGMFLSVEIDDKGDPLEKGDYPITYYCTAINRGVWRREAVRIIRRHGFRVDLKARPQESVRTMYQRIARRAYHRLRGTPSLNT